jgi:hypothetical protein
MSDGLATSTNMQPLPYSEQSPFWYHSHIGSGSALPCACHYIAY